MNDKIKIALEHVRSIHPEVTQVFFGRDGNWLFCDDCFNYPSFDSRIDTELLEDALGSIRILPYAYSMDMCDSFESWLEKNPGLDRFYCETHGAYEASKSYCNSCIKEKDIDRDDIISIIVNADWDSLDLDDVETIFKDNQEDYYKTYSNEQLLEKLKEYGLLDEE